MKNLVTPLGIFGLAYIIYGSAMTIQIFIEKKWSTYLFFILIGLGVLFLTINKVMQKLPNFRVWQGIIGVLPIALFYFYNKDWNSSYQLQIAPSQYKDYFNTTFQNGDIIFQTSKSSQSKAIQLATNSKYSHMGIIFINDGKYFVYEAIQPVKLTPLKEWINRGENGHYVVKRLKDAKNILTNDVINKMKRYGEKLKGKPYDMHFGWSDDKIYCSELVWKIYKEAANIEIGKLELLSDFDLAHNTVRTKMKERYGENIPMNEKVISPAAMFNSDKLITVVN